YGWRGRVRLGFDTNKVCHIAHPASTLQKLIVRHYPLLRPLACRLIKHAANVLPGSRSDWAQAMTNELEYVECDVTALRWAAGCVLASYIERGGRKMNDPANSFIGIVRKPCAFVPLAMSLTALGVVAVAAMSGGLVPRADEGAEAHIWQL